MSKETADISSSPGLILRTAREELKFSIDHVAHDLHLRASVVQSMENEDYDDFSSDVFLKGYFRSYCRLVNLHEERMVELLEVQLRTRKNEIENVALSAKKAEKAKFRKKLISVMFALALVAGLSVYVLGYLLVEDKPLQEGSPLPESTTSAPSDQ
ncbi:RodZ family helix-turn-helix domain-containing protein, partial [Oleiphilus sp. HI0043]